MERIKLYYFLVNQKDNVLRLVNEGLLPVGVLRDLDLCKSYLECTESKKMQTYAMLSEKYKVSESTVIKIIKKYL